MSIVSARSTFLYSFRNVNATSKRATRSPENRIGSVCCREDGGSVNDDDDPWRSNDDDEEEDAAAAAAAADDEEEDADAGAAGDSSGGEPALPIFPAARVHTSRVHGARRHADAYTDADADTTPVRRYPRCPPHHPSAPRDGEGLNATGIMFLRGSGIPRAVGPSVRSLIRTQQDRSQAQCKGPPPIDR